jgi:hypothetical protein
MAGKRGSAAPPAEGAELAGDGTGEALPPAQDGEQEAPGWDAEGEHVTAVDRMFSMVDELELDPKAMVYDVRDFLLDTIKQRPKPWSGTSQAEQRDVAAACEHAATELVRKVVEAVAANGVSTVRVLLTGLKLGSDMVITGKVKTFTDEEADEAVSLLHHSIGKHVMLTRATAEDYRQDKREAETDPDEPGFGFEAGGDDSDLAEAGEGDEGDGQE